MTTNVKQARCKDGTGRWTLVKVFRDGAMLWRCELCAERKVSE